MKSLVRQAQRGDDQAFVELIEENKQAMYTSKPEQERSGMGFSFMEAFMDELEVVSERNKGTTVVMKKRFVD